MTPQSTLPADQLQPAQPAPATEHNPPIVPPSADVSATKEGDIAGTEELTQSGFVQFLRAAMDAAEEANDFDQYQALEQLVELVEANPNEERTFIEMFVESIKAQAIAAYASGPVLVDRLNFIDPATLTVDVPEEPEVDERAERLKANAKAELDVMTAASVARQEAAEALAAEKEAETRPLSGREPA